MTSFDNVGQLVAGSVGGRESAGGRGGTAAGAEDGVSDTS
jgi:hypothetical protein